MVRTRFAPSPTGYLHVGGLRTALYCYLFARKNNGTFILRIEDTDQKRYVEGAQENLINTLKWMGLEFDEGPGKDGNYGPYIQSQRTEIYRKYADELVAKGDAYPCFCTAERLEAMRTRQEELKQAPMYDGLCQKLTPEEITAKKAAGEPFVIRQKIPKNQKLKFKDEVRGWVHFDTNTIDDQVLMKSDNFPTYHLANVVDDHFMEVTHVIRGEEWLPSTPKHILLYNAFGWKHPEFAHLPLLLNKDKTKLSKRQGDVSVEAYIEKGFLKEAIINFIALLGWHPGKGIEEEMFSLEDLVKQFSVEQIHKSGAVFDLDKLNWFNFRWERRLMENEIIEKAKSLGGEITKFEGNKPTPEQLKPFSKVLIESKQICTMKSTNDVKILDDLEAGKILEKIKEHVKPQWHNENDKLYKAIATAKEKLLQTPADTEKYLGFFFEQKPLPMEILENAKMKVDKPTAVKAIKASVIELENLTNYDEQEKIKEALMKVVQAEGLTNGQVFWPLRVALTSEQYSPGVFEVIWALGKSETLARLNKAVEQLA